MGSATKRRAVNEFLDTGEFHPGEELPDSVVPDGPLDAAWLGDVQQRRQWLAASPETELPLYRELYGDDGLSENDVDRLLEAMEQALVDPEGFYDALEQESVIGTTGDVLSCAWKIPKWFPTKGVNADQAAKIATLRATYDLPDAAKINPNEHHFEFCDPGWWSLIKAKAVEQMRLWPRGLVPFIEHGGERTFVYEAERPGNKIALMADFGVGQYHSTCIANTLERQAYPYVFHLGDVYYGGTEQEFADCYTGVLDRLMSKSTLFSMPENHELYSGGSAYQRFLRSERTKGRILQEGSYFCLRFPKHQLVAVDVNWHGRKRFQRKASREWLRDVIRSGEGRTTILLTGSAPFKYGAAGKTKLYDDMLAWSEQGRFDLWFWGDNHYCALFEREASKAPFIGSCIGHGGYPGGRQKPGRTSFVPPTWVETEGRFPPQFGLREDLSNNGWCELTMLDTGGVELLYVDWLGCKRFWAKYEFERTNPLEKHLALVDQQAFGRGTRL